MIAIITFNVSLRNGLSAYLKERDYAACYPKHRQDAQKLFEQHRPNVIVLDLYISQPNALTFLQNLRRHGYGGKVLALSGISNRNLISIIQRSGVDQVISFSPATPSTLLFDQIESMIRSCFRKEICKRAFEKHVQSGREHGHDLEDWFKAEHEILNHLKVPEMK